MPVERTEPRGTAELDKYYEVYETIGSGNNIVFWYTIIILKLYGIVFESLFIFQVALPKSNWAGIF